MRPVTKLKPGDFVRLLDKTTHEIQATYKPYGDAKEALAANIDEYCSYCERPVSDAALAVEHIKAKGLSKYERFKVYVVKFFTVMCKM